MCLKGKSFFTEVYKISTRSLYLNRYWVNFRPDLMTNLLNIVRMHKMLTRYNRPL